MTGVGRLQAKRTGGHEPTVNVAVRIAQSGHREYFRNGHRCRGRRSAGCQLTVAFDLSEKYRHLLGGPRAKAKEKFETVVIGGGQAGLAMSHHLAVLGCEHVIFERARVAELDCGGLITLSKYGGYTRAKVGEIHLLGFRTGPKDSGTNSCLTFFSAMH